ncbi:MAG: hypothetical protein ACRD8U_16235, partial [Pyrinomonadaceae bacterium]
RSKRSKDDGALWTRSVRTVRYVDRSDLTPEPTDISPLRLSHQFPIRSIWVACMSPVPTLIYLNETDLETDRVDFNVGWNLSVFRLQRGLGDDSAPQSAVNPFTIDARVILRGQLRSARRTARSSMEVLRPHKQVHLHCRECFQNEWLRQ